MILLLVMGRLKGLLKPEGVAKKSSNAGAEKKIPDKNIKE